ncbi:MAG: class B sortase [Lachnospiraceae bacterium]|nr:class B sortase [Lachnospiraceae bacterium]
MEEKKRRIAGGKKVRKEAKETKPMTPRQKKIFNIFTIAIMVLAACVFVYSGYQLYTNLKEYKDGQDVYDQWQNAFPTLGEVVDNDDKTTAEETSGTTESTGPSESIESTETEDTKSPEVPETQTEETEKTEAPEEPSTEEPAPPAPIDWVAFYNQMKAANPDYIGWIIIADTNINYPMVQTVDNDYYLYRLFDRTDNRAGSLFADYRCEDVFKYRNTIIYGHNRLDGSMFANLRKYETDWFYNSHPTFYIYTEDGPVLYQIFSIYVTDPGSSTYITRFASDEKYVEWLNERYELSRVKPNVVLDADTDIVTLSTCVNNSTQRLVVHAKRMN